MREPHSIYFITNVAITIFAAVVTVGLWYLWRLTVAKGFLLMAIGFTYLMVARILLIVGVRVFVEYSAQLALPLYPMMLLGVWLTIVKLRSVYNKK